MGSSPTLYQITSDTVSLKGVGDLTIALRNGGSPIGTKTAEALERLANGLSSVNNRLSSATISGPTPVPAPPPASVIEQSLAAGFTIPLNAADPTDTGQLLFVFLRAAGPTALFTWGAMFRFASTEFDSTGGLITVFSFVSKVDAIDSTLKWWQTCAQWTGQS